MKNNKYSPSNNETARIMPDFSSKKRFRTKQKGRFSGLARLLLMYRRKKLPYQMKTQGIKNLK